MWNKPTAKSIGEPTLKETNPANNNSYDVKFVIVPNELDCLLCLKTVQQLKLVTINADHFIHNVKEDFGDLGEVKLRVMEDARPTDLPARNIPLAIQSEVKEQTDNLVQRDVLISPAEPTEWVSQMAITKKSNGK